MRPSPVKPFQICQKGQTLFQPASTPDYVVVKSPNPDIFMVRVKHATYTIETELLSIKKYAADQCAKKLSISVEKKTNTNTDSTEEWITIAFKYDNSAPMQKINHAMRRCLSLLNQNRLLSNDYETITKAIDQFMRDHKLYEFDYTGMKARTSMEHAVCHPERDNSFTL